MNYSLCSMPLVSGLMVVLLTFILYGDYGFSSVGVSAILRNERRIQGQMDSKPIIQWSNG